MYLHSITTKESLLERGALGAVDAEASKLHRLKHEAEGKSSVAQGIYRDKVSVGEVRARLRDLLTRGQQAEDAPLFSRGLSSAGNVVDVSDFESVIHGVNAALIRAGSDVDIVLDASFADLPLAVQRANTGRDGKQHTVQGVFHDGRIHVVADEISSVEELEAVILHELYGHRGLRALFGDDIYNALNRLARGLGARRMAQISRKQTVPEKMRAAAAEQRKGTRGAEGQRQAPVISDIQDRSSGVPAPTTPIQIAPNAGAQLASLGKKITQGRALRPAPFLQSLASALGAKWDDTGKPCLNGCSAAVPLTLSGRVNGRVAAKPRRRAVFAVWCVRRCRGEKRGAGTIAAKRYGRAVR